MDWLSSPPKKTYSDLHSDVKWISLNRVIASLNANGFKQITDNPEILEFQKQKEGSGGPIGVTVAISISPADKSIWSYAVARISSKDTMDFDNQGFADANTAICGLFVSDKEWDDIGRFINNPLSKVGPDQPITDSMTFQDAFLKTSCELVTGTDGSTTLHQLFRISSKE